jgi:hypothetical protein
MYGMRPIKICYLKLSNNFCIILNVESVIVDIFSPENMDIPVNTNVDASKVNVFEDLKTFEDVNSKSRN